MRVEQAVFTSADSGGMRGYQLVSRSPGVDRRLSRELCRWAPTHGALLGAGWDTRSLNYFPAGEGWAAMTRTLYGGAEYSSRGAVQVVTLMLVFRIDQLAAYDYNAVALARTALALGRLRIVAGLGERLPAVELPRRPLVRRSTGGRRPDGPGPAGELDSVLAEAHDLLHDCRRVAITGLADPVAALEKLLARIPPRERSDVSFTTGLKPSARREFRLHFLPAPDVALHRRLASQGVHCVPAAR